MKKLILCFILLVFCGVNPLCAETGFGFGGFDMEKFVGRDTKNFLSDYLTARFSVSNDMEKQRYNWEENGVVYKRSTPEIYWKFYEIEAKPLYGLMEKEKFSRIVSINEIKNGKEPNTYVAEMTFVDATKGTEGRHADYKATLRLCGPKVCGFSINKR